MGLSPEGGCSPNMSLMGCKRRIQTYLENWISPGPLRIYWPITYQAAWLMALDYSLIEGSQRGFFSSLLAVCPRIII